MIFIMKTDEVPSFLCFQHNVIVVTDAKKKKISQLPHCVGVSEDQNRERYREMNENDLFMKERL